MLLLAIVGAAACYWLGWLPSSYAVAVLLVMSLLHLGRRPAGRSRRRPGYITPASNASGSGNQGTVARVRTYTGFRQAGPLQAGWDGQAMPRALSRTTARGASTSGHSDGSAMGSPPGIAGMGADDPPCIGCDPQP